MDISWTKQAGDGNAAIGSDRDTLISLVNDVKRMIESRDSAALSVSFELLEVWLAAHFKDEEKKARATDIDFSSRKFEQQYELNELGFLRDGLAARNGVWSDVEAKLDIQFLSNWLIEHIANGDLQKGQPQAGSGGHGARAGKETLAQSA
ncbi:MAG: hypothetical protein HY936_09690 [Nitrosomonadales bacterium]|nr:hypothetical protein [Nitrosomonadales bacterium]